MGTIKNHQEQATDFLEKTGTKFKAVYIDHKPYFEDDKECRDVYRIYLTRNGKRFSFTFGQSISNAGIEPTPYDVLACLQKYPVDTFEDFCHEFGYNEDSRKAEKIYRAIKREYLGVEQLFSDVLDQLREIC